MNYISIIGKYEPTQHIYVQSVYSIWEYLSQSNDNAEFVKESERFKFVDDLTFLEILIY